MRPRLILWLVLLASLPLLSGFGPPKLIDRESAPTVRLSVGELRQWAEQSDVPDVTAESYLVYDVTADQVLMARSPDTARPPASLTKLMTALLVFEHAGLEDTVTVVPDDLVGGAVMGLRANEEVSVRDLLWGLLLPSGNDAAMALARHVGGDVDSFVEQMNARSRQMGLDATQFANPHGFDQAEHISSARDLLTVTLALWPNAEFRSIVGTAEITMDGRELRNTNEWLRRVDGAVGVKTGTTDLAGECLIAAVERDGHTVILVLLGSKDRYADAETLYSAYTRAFAWEAAGAAELTVLNRVVDGQGTVHFVQPTGAAPTVLQYEPGVPPIRGFRRLEPEVSMPIAAGSQVGKLEWWAGTRLVGTQALVVR